MAEAGGNNNSLKLIFGCAAAIILLVIVMKQLDMDPKVIKTPGMEIEFGNNRLAPPTGQIQVQNQQLLEELAKMRRELNNIQVNRPIAPAPQVVNTTGLWQSPIGLFTIAQYGSQIVVQLQSNGIVTAVGAGAITDRTLIFNYYNYRYLLGQAQGTVVGNSQIHLTDNGVSNYVLTRIPSQ